VIGNVRTATQEGEAEEEDASAAVVRESGIVPIGVEDEMVAAGTTIDLHAATATCSTTGAAAHPAAGTETNSGSVLQSAAAASRRHPRSESQRPT
jgi:hypothetical protein